MNYITVFEAINIDVFKLMLINIIAIILYILIGIGVLIWYRHEKKKENPFKFRLFMLVGSMIFCLFLIIGAMISIINYPILKHNIYNQYVSNNVSITEGTADITIVTDDDDIQRISDIALKNVQFNTNSKYIYNYSDIHELCLQNGDYVRITYVTYKDENFIMKIEKREAPNPETDS